jgi:transcription antitermination factor NusG
VASVVSFGGEPAPIPDSEIEAVKTILRSGQATELCEFLSEGQLTRVIRGSLTGLEGVLVKKKTEWRLVVSIRMLQRFISVEIDREWVTAI